MSQTTIRHIHTVDGVLVDPSSISLASPDGVFGVKRTDTGAVVVPSGTVMGKVSLGVFEHTFDDPGPHLVYRYSIKIVYGGEIKYVEADALGGDGGETNLYSLLPRIQTKLHGIISDDYLKQSLRAVCVDFFLDTEAWEIGLPSITSVAIQAQYALSIGYDAYIRRVLDVKYDGRRWRYEVSRDAKSVILSPAPPESGKPISVTVVVVPNETLTQLQGWVLERYGYALVYGAIARLKAERNRPWYDPEGAAYYFNLYRASKGDSKGDKWKARHSAGLTARPRIWV